MEAETCFLWCNVEFVFLKWTSLDWKLVDSRFRNFIIQRWRWDSKTRTMIDKRSSNILARVYNVELWSQGSYEAQPCFKSLTLLSHCKLYNAGLPSRIVPLASLSSTFSSMSHYFQESDLVDIDSMSSGGFKSDDAIRSNISPLKRGKACAVCRSMIVLPCLLLVFWHIYGCIGHTKLFVTPYFSRDDIWKQFPFRDVMAFDQFVVPVDENPRLMLAIGIIRKASRKSRLSKRLLKH